MAEVTYTVCDRCQQGETPVGLAKSGTGRGWLLGTEEHAMEQCGWERHGKEILCPECLEEVDRG